MRLIKIGHRGSLSAFLLAALSGAMASVAFLDHRFFAFAWVCWVPLLFAIRHTSLLRAYMLGLVAGLVNFVSATYWICDFIMLSKAYSLGPALALSGLYWLYCAQLFALITVSIAWFGQTQSEGQPNPVPLAFVFPITLVAVFASFPMLFPYRFADSQVEILWALQAIEYTGAWGADWIIGIVNVIAFHTLNRLFGGSNHPPRQSPRTRLSHKIATLSATMILIVWLAFGLNAYSDWEQDIADWPTQPIGLVQPNETPDTDRDKLYPGFMRGYPPEMAITEQLVKAGAELVIWPEARYKGMRDKPQVAEAYRSHIERLNTPLIFQDIETLRQSGTEAPLEIRHNTAMMLSSDGTLAGQYQKVKLIPFGESIPIIGQSASLRAHAEVFLGEFLNEMVPGTEPSVFPTQHFDIVPLICYETVFPEFVAESLMTVSRRAQYDFSNLPSNTQTDVHNDTHTDFHTEAHPDSHTDSHTQTRTPPYPLPKVLVALSNNGWFGSSHQPWQHVMPSRLRAIETRTPLIHVVNNGPSIVSTPSGALSFVTPFQSTGGFLTELAYPPKHRAQHSTFYMRHPDLFLNSVRVLMILMLMSLWLRAKSRT